jgi:hypothetical protein
MEDQIRTTHQALVAYSFMLATNIIWLIISTCISTPAE